MAQVAIEQLGRRRAFGSVVPTAGTWIVGDEVKNTAPSNAGIEKWVCVTAGTPGTWEAIYVPGVVLSPAQITANSDDYNPTNLATAYVLRLSTDASRDLTGIVGGASRRELVLANIGSFNIVLKHNVTSTAANRFYCPGSADYTLGANAVVRAIYDATSLRWRFVAVVPPSTALPKDVTFVFKGTLATGSGVLRWYNDTGTTLTFSKVRGSVGTVSATYDIICDVNVNASSIFASSLTQPRVNPATSTGTTTTFATTTIADGQYLTVDIDQVGSAGNEGADLTVTIWLSG